MDGCISASEISNWTITNGVSPYTTTCASYNLFGGYQTFNDLTILERYIPSLPSHYRFEMDVLFFSIDNFNGKTLEISFDGVVIGSFTFQMVLVPPSGSTMIYLNSKSYNIGQLVPGYYIFNSPHNYGYAWISGSQLCGGLAAEYSYILKVVSEHNSSNINIKFSINGNSNIGYWGIKSLNYFVWSSAFSSSCSINCLICNSNICQYCSGIKNQDSACIAACSPTYISDTYGNCYTCSSSCVNCNGSSPESCTSCDSSKWLLSGSCLSNCPNGYYGDTSNRTCILCDSSCLTCNGPTNSSCLSCVSGLFFSDGRCVSSCPTNKFENPTNNSCETCDSSCQTCSGSLNTDCLSCFTSNYLDSNDNSCHSCDSTCFSCNGGSSFDCLSCSSWLYYSQGSCINLCAMNQFVNISNHSCHSCDISCESCSGPFNNNCLSCHNGRFLSLNSCVSVCPNNEIGNSTTKVCETSVFVCSLGYYLNKTNNICNICDSSCLECSGPKNTECISCNKGSFLQNYSICSPCHNSCETCNGSSQNNCLSCNRSKFLENNACIDCDETCETCSGPNSTDCLSCKSSDYLESNGNCAPIICENNQFWNTKFSYCQNCDISCETCFGEFANHCNSCKEGYVLSGIRCYEIQNLTFTIEKNENPFNFTIGFSSFIGETDFFQLLVDMISVEISNFNKKLFTYSLIPINFSHNYSLILNYSDFIQPNNSVLTVFIENTIEPRIFLTNKSANFLLESYNPCDNSINYYIKNGNCFPKITFDYEWLYTDQYDVISILFKILDKQENSNKNGRILQQQELDPVIVKGIESGMFYADINILSIKKHFQYQFVIENGSVNLHINFTNEFYGGIDINLKFNESRFLEVNDSEKVNIIKKELTISILDYSINSQNNQTQLMDFTRNFCVIGEVLVTILIIFSFVFNSKSSFAIRGLLLIKFFQIIKYININYPQNARVVFTNGISNVFLQNNLIETTPIDELLHGLPHIFVYYNVSLIIINNILDEYIFVFTIFACSLILFYINRLVKKGLLKKIIVFLHEIFVWNFLLMVSFSKYINTVFCTFVSLRFAENFHLWNTFISFIVLFYIILLPLHLTIVIKKIGFISKNKQNFPEFISQNRIVPNVEPTFSRPGSNQNYKKSKFSPEIDTISSNVSEEILQIKQRKSNKIIPWKDFHEYLTPTLPGQSPKHMISNENSDYSASSKKILIPRNSFGQSGEITQNEIFTTKENFQNNQKKTEKNNNEKKRKKCFQRPDAYLKSIYKKIYEVREERIFLKKYGILKEDFREGMGLHKLYHSFYIGRYFMVPFIVVFLYDFTLIQMTSICLMNILFFIFIVFEIPFKRRSTSCFNYINELCINVCYFSALALSFLDINQDRDINLRINYGWAIAFSYIGLLSSLLATSIFKILKGICRVIQSICICLRR